MATTKAYMLTLHENKHYSKEPNDWIPVDGFFLDDGLVTNDAGIIVTNETEAREQYNDVHEWLANHVDDVRGCRLPNEWEDLVELLTLWEVTYDKDLHTVDTWDEQIAFSEIEYRN